MAKVNAFLSDSSIVVIYTNFTKAFDKVNHTILVHKLNHIGLIFGPLLYDGSNLKFHSILKLLFIKNCIQNLYI